MQSPIGIFDSGIGGLTVANAIRQVLPNENLVYFGDTAHMPYGDKSAEAIKYYSLKIGKFLQAQGCKAIVIACNTASSLGYHDLKEFLGNQLPILNVIDPVVSYCKQQPNYKKIGVIATKATIKSDVYAKKLKENIAGIQVRSLATPLLAPMIEEGFFENNISKTIINAYLSSPKLKKIDSLILACTHYPLISHEIDEFFKGKVEILNTAQIVADDVKKQLEILNLLNNTNAVPKHQFFVSDKTTAFENSTQLFFEDKISLTQRNIWER
ncbi:glutamate racemase [Pedobacter sp. SD-b]|uniref:Glutamate racemase n=1 Tax=Pedobacter segetis TaxID=2793069 RepID=A0ABS1BNF4_9SPHI|nr:glutamate racemase [Pedobacter segetis]MBK0384427.1 glutamate racemase [Pedobacter segetis]